MSKIQIDKRSCNLCKAIIDVTGGDTIGHPFVSVRIPIETKGNPDIAFMRLSFEVSQIEDFSRSRYWEKKDFDICIGCERLIYRKMKEALDAKLSE